MKDGSINVFRNNKTPERIKILLSKTAFKNIGPEQMVFAEQIHGNIIKGVIKSDGGSIRLGVDGLVTKEKGLLLVIKSADCMPVLFYDPVKKVIAAVHCGFLGVIRKILPETVKFLKKEFGCRPKNLIVGIGPHISQENYKLKNEKIAIIKNNPEFKKFLNDGKFSIKDAGVSQLVKNGVLVNNIEISNICTFASSGLFFSYRYAKATPGYYKEEKSMTGTFIGLK